MRIAGNKVKHLVTFFHLELKDLYSVSEIDEFSFRVFEHYLGFKREEMKAREEDNINQSELLSIYDAAKELSTGKPLQYIFGETYFYKFNFYVNEHVLIPRPETEELVDLIYKENEKFSNKILDLGTGSGCIPVSLKKLLPNGEIHACDISDEALGLARKNATRNNADVIFFKADILHLPSSISDFEIVISNPPYIRRNEASQIHDNVKKFEPHLALFVDGEDSIIFYKKIIDLCEDHLKLDGKLYFELNPLTAVDVKAYADAKGIFSQIDLLKDLSGNLRFLRGIKK